MNKDFTGQRNPIPTTDLIVEYYEKKIFDRLKKKGKEYLISTANPLGVQPRIVVIQRKNPPIGLAIPGGFAEPGISYEENTLKEGSEELPGMKLILLNSNRPWVYSDPKRDPRGHITSNTYILIGTGKVIGGDDARSAHLYTINDIIYSVKNNGFVFDHGSILKDYLMFRGYLKK